MIRELAEAAGYTVAHTALLPDGVEPLASELKRLCDEDLADLILTTGGTGFSPTDLTPEATRSVVERPAPGIAEAMRWQSLQITPRAMLSRAAAAGPDRQPARQPQGGAGVPGVYPPLPGPRAGDSQGHRGQLRLARINCAPFRPADAGHPLRFIDSGSPPATRFAGLAGGLEKRVQAM